MRCKSPLTLTGSYLLIWCFQSGTYLQVMMSFSANHFSTSTTQSSTGERTRCSLNQGCRAYMPPSKPKWTSSSRL
ncbi:hypothetical protein PF005_g33259 [Phytophthora fragariae]|uniref:Secreted protein n=1 Tax=Phytophthora fragariae TaxID=53985 RepID=A0A6A3Q343_9STRA|nr:hypothetical protein PF009_g31459 [Phytophthora fragariae]KAE9067859.1 hypothetical protein PF007_g27915 [Phytophthora fragariae]KAE9073211.1 hypothetical protein PF006_g28788 [Phytophthora fragariae]KAE9156318.1 hypothetical protein PF005_g33259 [Phytophthora fragariae]KAE9156395.1 hypothetical protein PF004_g32608 [Phytophthora fragariae]